MDPSHEESCDRVALGNDADWFHIDFERRVSCHRSE